MPYHYILVPNFDSTFHIPMCRILLHSAATRSHICHALWTGLAPSTHCCRNLGTAQHSISHSEIRNSEYSAVADNLDWRTTRLWSLFLCDLPTSFPGRAFEYLREGELFLRQVEFGSYLLRDSVPGGGRRNNGRGRVFQRELVDKASQEKEKRTVCSRTSCDSQFYYRHRAPLHYGWVRRRKPGNVGGRRGVIGCVDDQRLER